MRRAPVNLCACAAAAAASVALAACGSGERQDADAPQGTYTVAVERATFPREQRLARPSTLALTVRNAGDTAIPNLTVTVRGFTDDGGGARDSDPTRDIWILDAGPPAAATAFEDTWTAGRLEPGRATALRWQVTPAVAGAHEVVYEIAPVLTGSARARLSDGALPRATLRVRVSDRPATARVDPRTGAVERTE